MSISADSSSFQLAGFAGLGLVALAAVYAVAVIWPLARIIRRAGYSGWWVLASFVPVVNIVLFWWFAFMKWPAQRELEQWRTLVARMDQARTAPVNAASMGY
jgi:uncharacterized membrane protein YhaH (DUF805 family)